MSGAYAFELPQGDIEVAVRLIAAVPPTWSWLDGQLDAPLEAVADGLVTLAGFKIDRGQSPEPSTLYDVIAKSYHTPIEARRSYLQYRREAIVELLSATGLPQFVRFDNAGFDQAEWGLIPLESAKRIALAYVRRGYLGDLFFQSDCYDNCGSYNPERCSIHLAPFTELSSRSRPLHTIKPFMQLIEEMRAARAVGNFRLSRALWEEQFPPHSQHPALIKLEWDKRYGGKKANLASLLAVCREFELPELDAAEIKYGFSYMPQAEGS